MKNAYVLNMLNEISNYLDKEEYIEASEYIRSKKREINNTIDPASEYMDKLVKDLTWKSKNVEFCIIDISTEVELNT